MGTDLKTYVNPKTGLKIICFSAAHTRDLFERLGYDYRQYNPESQEEVTKVSTITIKAQLESLDAAGRPLSIADLDLLAAITGRD